MRSLSSAVIENLKSKGIEDELAFLKIEYAILALKNEGIKMLLLLFFYILINKIGLFLFCATILLPVRAYSGGMHMKKNATCFIFSFAFFFLSINILPKITLNETFYFVILVSSVICIWIFSPVASCKRPIKGRQKYIRCKVTAIGFSLIACIFLLYFHNMQSYFHSGVWVLFLQCLQLIAAFIAHKKGIPNEKEI